MTAPAHAITAPPFTPDTGAFCAFTLADGRRAGFSWDAKPRCVHGHRIDDDAAPITEGITRCHHRQHRGAGECGVRIYLALLTFGGSAAMQGSGERCYFVVEVTRSHVRRMKLQPMIFLERLSLLACVLPGVSVDLAASSPGLTSTED